MQVSSNSKLKQEQAIGTHQTGPVPLFSLRPSLKSHPASRSPHLSLLGQLSGTPRAARALPTSSLWSFHTIFRALARYGLRPLIPAVLAPLGPRLTTHLLGVLTAGWSAKNGLRTLLERKMLGFFFSRPRGSLWSQSEL